MKIAQVAAQLYTIRDFLKTPADIAASMKKIRKIGYQAVQVSGMGPIPEADLLTILRGEGLTLCATHEPGKTILENPAAVVERLKKLACRYTAYPYPGGIKFETMAEVQALTAGLNAAGKLLVANGQVLTYHNHDIEFRKVDGRLILELIYEQTEPANLQGEIDTFWVKAGGGDPAAWCRKLKHRLPLLHMKDFKLGPDGKPLFAEIGSGTLDWPAIISASEASGCQWFIVEQDAAWANNDPFQSLAISFNYIRDRLCQG